MTREEAIEIVKTQYFHDTVMTTALGMLIPELRESKDEKIRKYLIDELKTAKSVGELKFTIPQPTREECIAYLEKQKEQKPAEWSEEDEKMRYFVTEAVQSRYSDRELAKYLDPKIINEKKQLKQKLFDWLRCIHHSWKPSKQQMEALHEAVIRSCSHHYGVELSNLEIDLLNLK